MWWAFHYVKGIGAIQLSGVHHLPYGPTMHKKGKRYRHARSHLSKVFWSQGDMAAEWPALLRGRKGCHFLH